MEWSENVSVALEPGAIRVDIRRGPEEDDRVITITGGNVS